ncbi:MAG: cytochrome c biogenesis protein CcsA [Planctomycetota bacterium]|nr:cytochrome c biogenesis protein CcsA [Planctomycetota bacterium]
MELKLTPLGFLVYLVMAVYLATAAAYFARLRRLGEGLYAFGFVVAAAAFGLRWHQVNHAPLQSLFEVCLCLGMLIWPITLFCRRFLGVADEAADALIGFIILFPAGFIFKAEMQHLMPALQSPLFIPHVAAYMLAYVIMAKAAVQALGALEWRTRLAILVFVAHRVGLILAFSYLVRGGPPHETMWWNPLGWMLMPSMTALYHVAGGEWTVWVILGTFSDLVVNVGMAALLATAKALQAETQAWREQGAYRVTALGFPLLTLGLLLGAVWGKIAWSDYWNWDPKELWSLISWLVFLGYFHFRYMYGRRFPRINSALVLVGLAAIILTLLWVPLASLFKGGMHSYAS